MVESDDEEPPATKTKRKDKVGEEMDRNKRHFFLNRLEDLPSSMQEAWEKAQKKGRSAKAKLEH
jgi:hypothetical protein